MPELPEIETIKNQLNQKIKDKKIADVDIRFKKPLRGVSSENFKKSIEGAKIENIERRAKLLLINLSNSNTIIFHLKLTGRLLFVSKNTEYTKHTHIIFNFKKDGKLFFEDYRKFGFIKIIPVENLDVFFKQERLGPEPLEKNFTLKIFKELLSKKLKSKIKPLLMDQTFIAGIGNIYASEICFCAGILPNRVVKTLKDGEIKKLYNCIKIILKKAIDKRGSSVDAYLDSAGRKGDYEKFLKVYGRGGKKCSGCKSILKQTKLGGRGTVYCSVCQK